MKRIEIQGAIVPPEFDLFLLPAGLATTSSSFTRSLREAEAAGEEIEVWINSPGGDVDAGNEMLAAFQSFKGYKCVTVGGLAASMAANFVLQCGARVEVHENTRIMFHSAYADTCGGAGSLRDVADALDRINAPMIARLKELGVPAERVDEGFAEGRAFWLDAQEAVKYGIAAKIVKGAAPVKTTLSDTLALTDAVGRAAAWYRIARFPETQQTSGKMKNTDPKACNPTPPATDPAPAPTAPAP
ncbi:MAG: Clp protease ClpP, partial [Kiritimatiellae bacterium]|nr:Clp protease ClpP [Kiritimatiellia bacterium]